MQKYPSDKMQKADLLELLGKLELHRKDIHLISHQIYFICTVSRFQVDKITYQDLFLRNIIYTKQMTASENKQTEITIRQSSHGMTSKKDNYMLERHTWLLAKGVNSSCELHIRDIKFKQV